MPKCDFNNRLSVEQLLAFHWDIVLETSFRTLVV